jgi:hypothetical protein
MFAMVAFCYWIFMVQSWNIIQCIFKANVFETLEVMQCDKNVI